MPFTEVMKKFSKGLLHSGSKKGPLVKNRKQAIAIRMSEKRKADEGEEEYQPDNESTEKKDKKKKKGKVSTGPTGKLMKKYGLD